MGDYIWSLGTFLAGALLNTFLLGLVTNQYILYCKSKFNDCLWIQTTVYSLLFLDILHSALTIYIIWFYIVLNFNNPANVNRPFWAYLLTPIMETLSAVLTQNFLARRLYHLNGRRSTYSFLLALISLNLTLAVLSTIKSFSNNKTWDFVPNVQTLYVPWLIVQMVTDIIISTSLALEFNAFRTGVSNSDQVLWILIRKAVQTGLFATIFTICAASTLVLARQTTGHLCGAFIMPLGRIYANALLDTLLMRTNFREIFSRPENLTEIVARDLQILGYRPIESEHNSESSISVYTYSSSTVV